MTMLQVVYASAPASEVLIPTLEIRIPGIEPIRICTGYKDMMFGVEGQMVPFEAGSLSISLPSVDTTGQQTLNFGTANVNGQAQRYVEAALESEQPTLLIYREYLLSDITEPAKRPYVMTMSGGVFEGFESEFSASYYDILNTAWPRERYTAETAPGIRYL